MNRGAAEANGDVLLFLHADTRLPKNFDRLVLRSLAQPGIAAGAFELRIDTPTPGLRLIERIANWRSRCLRTPYGDQGIFMLTRVFHGVGGFSDFPIMEDFELIRRLQKKGKIITLSAPVLTSSRRWQNFGILKTTLINQLVIITYYMGIPPDTIARLYRRKQGILTKS
jgi:rSAM/selenodomain-associated transferase 2